MEETFQLLPREDEMMTTRTIPVRRNVQSSAGIYLFLGCYFLSNVKSSTNGR